MRGTVVKVRIGQPVPASEIAGFDVPSLGRYLRNRCYALEAQCLPEKTVRRQIDYAPLADPVPPERIREEIDSLEDRILFEVGDYRAYLLTPAEAPWTMKELYRLREETFRLVGEGTGQPEDTDVYDAYYRQMILWHLPNREIAGAYRLGFGPEISAEHGGVSGFYTSTLVRYGEKAASMLARSLELGRSFIIAKYQREVQPLRLLFTGLGVSTLKYKELEYYSGPVSISNEIPLFYKSLIVRYLETNFPLQDADKVALPSHAFVPDYLRVNPDDLLSHLPEGNIDAFDKLLCALSDGKYRLPVLVRKYFNIGARLVCFDVDPDFSDSLDGHIFLRYADFPPQSLRSFLRGLPEERQDAVWFKFFGVPRK
jgi:hypothetical protein